MPAPDLRLLAYHERVPMLRVVRLASSEFEPAPVPLDTGHALDDCLRRDRWIAFWPNLTVWGVPVPFGSPAFEIARDTQIVSAGFDPRTVWLRTRDADVIAEYDGVARKVRREVPLPTQLISHDLYLVAEADGAFLLGGCGGRGLFEWRPGSRPRPLLEGVGVAGTNPSVTTVTCFNSTSDELVIFDLRARTQVTVPQPTGARWGRSNFSPDGDWLAIDLDYSPRPSAEETMAALREVAAGRGQYKPRPHRLALVRCADGSMTIADGEFDNFPYPLVWSRDSSCVVFLAPFQPRGLWLTRLHEGRLQRVKFTCNAPAPLCDVSDAVS